MNFSLHLSGSTAVAKADFYNSINAGLEGLLHPLVLKRAVLTHTLLSLRRKRRSAGAHLQHFAGEASEQRILRPFALAGLDGVHDRDDQIENPARRKNQPNQREESKERS